MRRWLKSYAPHDAGLNWRFFIPIVIVSILLGLLDWYDIGVSESRVFKPAASFGSIWTFLVLNAFVCIGVANVGILLLVRYVRWQDTAGLAGLGRQPFKDLYFAVRELRYQADGVAAVFGVSDYVPHARNRKDSLSFIDRLWIDEQMSRLRLELITIDGAIRAAYSECFPRKSALFSDEETLAELRRRAADSPYAVFEHFPVASEVKHRFENEWVHPESGMALVDVEDYRVIEAGEFLRIGSLPDGTDVGYRRNKMGLWAYDPERKTFHLLAKNIFKFLSDH